MGFQYGPPPGPVPQSKDTDDHPHVGGCQGCKRRFNAVEFSWCPQFEGQVICFQCHETVVFLPVEEPEPPKVETPVDEIPVIYDLGPSDGDRITQETP